MPAEAHVEFAQLARRDAEKRRLPARHVTALLAFASLRTAISDRRYYGGRPIAEPVDEVVEEIERLWMLISSPPRVLTVLGGGDVCQVHPDEPISVALNHVRRFDYSQLPAYDNSGYVGILTTNAIGRWLADQLSRNTGLAEEEPVRQVMRFAEAGRARPRRPAQDYRSGGDRPDQPGPALRSAHHDRQGHRLLLHHPLGRRLNLNVHRVPPGSELHR